MTSETHKLKKSKKIWLATISILIAIIIIFVFLAHRQIGQYLTRKSTELLSKSLKAEIKAKEIKGNLFTGIAFLDVNIKFASGDSFYASNVMAEYDLFAIIFRKAKNVKGLTILKPIIFMTAEPATKPSGTKTNLPIALPLLLINRIEIKDGSIFYDEKPVLDSFSIKANLHLHSTGGNFYIDKLAFSLSKPELHIQNLQGNINLSNNALSLQNVKIISDNSSINFGGRYDLVEKLLSLEIKNGQIDLADFSKHVGKLQISSSISANINPNQWQLSRINGVLEYQNADITIKDFVLPDGQGKLTFYDTLVKINHTSKTINDSIPSRLSIDAGLLIKDLSYQGNAQFSNFRFPISYLKFPIDGVLEFNGTGTDSLDLNLFGSSQNPKIESISGQGFLRKGKLDIKNLHIKDGKSLLMLNGSGQITGLNKSLDCNYEFFDFSLDFASIIYRSVTNSNLALQGLVNGVGKLSYQNHMFSSSGKITLDNGSVSDNNKSRLKKFSLKYDLTDIKQLSGVIKWSAESLALGKNLIPNMTLSLSDSHFTVNLKDARENSLALQGNLISSPLTGNFDCTIDSFILLSNDNRFINTDPFHLQYQDHHLSLKDFGLMVGNGNLKLDLTINSSTRPSINLNCSQLDLKLLSDIFILKKPLSGTINCNVKDTLNNNSYAISVLGDSIKIPIGLITKTSNPSLNNNSSISLKYIEGNCLLNKADLFVNNINIVHRQDTSKITGKIDLIAKSMMDNPLDMNIAFADPGTWVFFFIKNVIDVRDGKLFGHGKITGTLNKPNLSGSINVADAKMFIVPTNTACDKINGKLAFDKQTIFIRNLTGNAETGKIKADGLIHLRRITKVDTMSYQIEFQNAPMRFQKEVFAIAAGSLNIDQGTPALSDSSNPLFINGNITIKEALLTPDFSSSSALGNGTRNAPVFNLKIVGDRDIWLRNQLADVELSCDLNIITMDKKMVFSGKLNAIQGSLYYLDHTLKLSKGDITFDNTSELNPLLDISADLETRPIKIQSEQAERIKIILTLSGRIKEPVFTFTSDPPVLSNEDIMSYLAINVTWQEMTASELRATFTTAISDKLLGYFERELTKRLRGFVYLDYLWFESGLVGGTGAKVTVGKYIGPKLYFTYEYNISQTANDVFRLEYYMTKAHQIIGERDDDNRYNLKYQYKIRY